MSKAAQTTKLMSLPNELQLPQLYDSAFCHKDDGVCKNVAFKICLLFLLM